MGKKKETTIQRITKDAASNVLGVISQIEKSKQQEKPSMKKSVGKPPTKTVEKPPLEKSVDEKAL